MKLLQNKCITKKDVFEKYHNDNTLLHLISQCGNDKYLHELLQEFKKEISLIIDNYNKENITALHEAASYGYITICKLLIENGANINIKNNCNNTPIHYAILNGHTNVVELFIEYGCNLHVKNDNKQTPYKLLFKYMKTVINKLLDKKVTIIARISSKYKKNVSIVNEDNIIINKRLQKIYVKNHNLQNNTKKLTISKKKVLPVISKKINKFYSIKDSQLSSLTTLSGKTKKILVEYNYQEIKDCDISKFINKEYIEIVTHPWFITLMNYYWITFAKQFFIRQFFMSFLYLLFFTISSTLYTYNSIHTTNYTNNTVISSFTTYRISYMVFDCGLLILNTLFLINEIYELTKLSKKKILQTYLLDKWNILDNIQIILVYTVIGLKFTENEYDKIIISILYPIFFIKFLKLLRGFRKIGPYIRALFKMMYNIYQFMGIFSIFIIGFSQSFFTLMYNIPQFINPLQSMLSTLDMTLSNIEMLELINNSHYPVIMSYIYRTYLIISTIILLNMLIAILETSYTKIIENSTKEWQVERSKLILSLMNNVIHNKKKYKTIKNINKLYCLENDKPVKGIQIYSLEYI